MSRVPANRPPSFMSRAELAWELSISESQVDELARLKILTPDSKRTSPEPMWLWNRVVERLERMPRCGTIYVVGFGNYRKIGYTDGWPPLRYTAIQTGCPEKLIVYCEGWGTRQDERDLHRRFAEFGTWGEWFRCEGTLAEWIEQGCQCLQADA